MNLSDVLVKSYKICIDYFHLFNNLGVYMCKGKTEE